MEYDGYLWKTGRHIKGPPFSLKRGVTPIFIGQKGKKDFFSLFGHSIVHMCPAPRCVRVFQKEEEEEEEKENLSQIISDGITCPPNNVNQIYREEKHHHHTHISPLSNHWITTSRAKKKKKNVPPDMALEECGGFYFILFFSWDEAHIIHENHMYHPPLGRKECSLVPNHAGYVFFAVQVIITLIYIKRKWAWKIAIVIFSSLFFFV